MTILKEGMSGPEVERLQDALKRHGFDPGRVDGQFGPGTEAAILAFQKSEGLRADGVAGPKTQQALGLEVAAGETDAPFDLSEITVGKVSKMFPLTPLDHIKVNLPHVLKALDEVGLADKDMVLMALATIRAETASFQPISEFRSKFNTSPGGHPFNLYDSRKDLGNRGAPDGDSYKGRGFIQLTGRANYQTHGAAIGIGDQLVSHPELANDPAIAARLLASFLKSKESRIRAALHEGDLAQARRLVNGGSHGLAEFSAAFKIGDALF
ncbi:MAG: peptidoglycan-binding protein [Candidatus Accumulibacter propinquus]|jgi:putative chitinase|uniref:peptidoglycan-binding protein n=1 Tax=Candidatus Accumulibacter TaxID=327159 RepID=UPI001AC6846A|nr:peptidoglycan-binding protein [Accumulibacter sp.]MBK8384614.1 peptidoglycan-binding protein [Accumulibacter sp.]MBK8578908.1 peptidoglycan-binding protein [Candidatus Accumulibacter propinquus]MBN8436674.1 peptidoglycan-binding protein [Accumulibacter sp.]